MNPEGIPYSSPGFPNPGSAALALDFNPEWVAYRRATNAQGATLAGCDEPQWLELSQTMLDKR